MLFAASLGNTPVSEPEMSRASVLAALDCLVAGSGATWLERGTGRVELRCSSGAAWLLDDSGVTRLR